MHLIIVLNHVLYLDAGFLAQAVPVCGHQQHDQVNQEQVKER